MERVIRYGREGTSFKNKNKVIVATDECLWVAYPALFMCSVETPQ